MSFAKVYSAQPSLLAAHIIDVEVDLGKGLHAFTIVGLPDKAVEEARDRMSAAIKNAGFTSPKSKNQKVVISLAPADLKKEGPIFDLAIALAYLKAAGEIRFDSEGILFLGELSLDGRLRPVRGVLPIARRAQALGYQTLILPQENASEAALIEELSVHGAETLADVLSHVDRKRTSEKRIELARAPKTKITYRTPKSNLSLSDIRGQERAKRGLEIAAAGGHNIALFGPPGTGKTMLARAFTALLPPLSFDEILETTSIHSVAGLLDDDMVTIPPFRSPHHTSSYVSIVGGGSIPKPGEVTLAHRGVLFLDEFPEFERRVIDALRQPLEDRVVNISRIKGSAAFPAQFILVAAMNPCPCGHFGTPKECICNPSALLRYQRKLSGPIIDRIDLWIEVPHIDTKMLSIREKRARDEKEVNGIKKRIKKARAREQARAGKLNSELLVRDLESTALLSKEAENALNGAAKTLDLSPRAYHRVIKLARTIADLDESDTINKNHILEALQYRPKSMSP